MLKKQSGWNISVLANEASQASNEASNWQEKSKCLQSVYGINSPGWKHKDVFS